jgi:hypothetical protein
MVLVMLRGSHSQLGWSWAVPGSRCPALVGRSLGQPDDPSDRRGR